MESCLKMVWSCPMNDSRLPYKLLNASVDCMMGRGRPRGLQLDSIKGDLSVRRFEGNQETQELTLKSVKWSSIVGGQRHI